MHTSYKREILNPLIEDGKQWKAMDVAKAAAVAIEDLAIESVAEWAGTAQDFGEGVFNELFDEDHVIREIYQCAAVELFRSSLLRNDTTGLLVTLARLAANQWFLRQASTKHGQ